MNKYLISNIKLGLNSPESSLLKEAARKLGASEEIIDDIELVKMSLDARKKNDIHHLCTVRVYVKEPICMDDNKDIQLYVDKTASPLEHGKEKINGRPVVIGSGPCGMFAALLLANEGYRPIIIERGSDAQSRAAQVDNLMKNGILDMESNVLFGEGGAGTFSDGKLTTRSKDSRSLIVLNWLVEMGAPNEILHLAKPHIGTDKLREIVVNIRKKIESLGGSYMFNTCVNDFIFKDGSIIQLKTIGKNAATIDTNACILAIGHSARDTYELLLQKGLCLEAKAFAVGIRIEHPQELIDKAQFGESAGHKRLGAAEYALTAKSVEGRGVYSFCMCPGGQVVCSSSGEGQVSTNGMSFHARDGKNANAAIVVQVSPSDFGNKPLDGINFQLGMEKAAFIAGGGGFIAPAQKLSDFMANKPTTKFGSVEPSYMPGVKGALLSSILPGYVNNGIKQGIVQFARKIRGFDYPDAVLTGVETRTSAPLRILRGEDSQVIGFKGFYAAGEGSGYAGGIISAAIDGLKAASSLIETYGNEQIR